MHFSSAAVNRLRNKTWRLVKANRSRGKMLLWLLSDVEMLPGKGAALWLHTERLEQGGGTFLFGEIYFSAVFSSNYFSPVFQVFV